MMRARSWLPLLALAAFTWMGSAKAQGLEEKRFYLTPFVGWTMFDRERLFANGQELKDAPYFGGRLGARLGGPVWLDIAAGTTTTTTDCPDCDETWSHISGNLMLSSSEQHAINPFLSVGGGAARSKHAIGPDEDAGNLEAAAGFKLRLSESIGLRLEARNVLWVPKEHWGKAHIDDIVVGAGLVLGFGGAPDTDGDGVADSKDRCANTPRGCQVDATGCPIDSDGDGVCNGLDKCPDTPAGAQVDGNGCPKDSDGDGVFDGIDQCADSPKGCTVDARGCPIDTDGDGVCDALDQCASSPRGCQVDASGCPLDSDHDGVCNGLDKCPETPAGVKVDAEGCTIVEREKQLEQELLNTGMIRLSNINFDYNKATIRPEAHAVLDTVGRILTKWPGLRIEIGGHTDSRGSVAYNHALSHRRAQAVRTYLLAHFTQFRRTQLTAKGFGESTPIAPNTTEEGMQANRRVEFVVLNREVLKREP